MADAAGRRIPEATVARLPLYYRALLETTEHQVATISSERLAELAGVNAAKVRKDLSYLGSYGTRGVGYDVEYLLHEISRELGLTRDWPVVIVGIGNLGRALANYRGLRRPRVSRRGVGGRRSRRSSVSVVSDQPVEPIEDLDRIVKERQIAIAILATPAGVAQDVADQLVAAGRQLDPQLRPRRAHGPGGRLAAQGRPCDRAADPLLLPTAARAPGERLPVTDPASAGRTRPGLSGVPVNLLVRGRRVVVVGAGRIAARKIEPLLDGGAEVVVVAPHDRRRGAGLGGSGPVHRPGPAVRTRRPRRRVARLHRHRRPRRQPGGVRGGRGPPDLGEQRRRSGQLLVYPDVRRPPVGSRDRDRYRRTQSGAGVVPAPARSERRSALSTPRCSTCCPRPGKLSGPRGVRVKTPIGSRRSVRASWTSSVPGASTRRRSS